MLGALLISMTISTLDPAADWLVACKPWKAELKENDGKEIRLQNGLLRRTFRLAPNAATVALDNLTTGQNMVRSVKPEAVVEFNGKPYEIGGLKGQPEHAYLLPKWLETMTSDPAAFQFKGYRIVPTEARFPWKRVRYSQDLPWPPKGKGLVLEFVPPKDAGLDGVTVEVHYELYDGMPALSKWLEIRNESHTPVTVNRFESEILAVTEYDNSVESWANVHRPWIHMQSDYAFCGFSVDTSNQTTEWTTDPEFISQISYELKSPCLLKSRPPIGPDQTIQPGGSFESFRTFELLHDSDDREHQGLGIRRMLRAMAPWATENPIMMHLRASDSEHIRQAVDQCAAVGFEMIVISFWSGLEMESQDPAYIARIKADVDYAHSKGIQIGGYTLTASRDAGAEANVVNQDVPNPKTQRKGAVFGQSPCLASEWSDGYYARLRNFIEKTGFDLIEDDGSYPGDVCASTQHLHHKGLDDSQWVQWKTITAFYQWLRARGGYINAPDYYFLAGSNKSAMGYRETNWSLPRDRQIILGRQNLFDGTWEKTPSMGWMFVPLTEYQGGGAAATIEPLKEHLPHYEAHLAQNFGAGVQACYRGPRLFDTDKTKAVIRRWVKFYRKHRAILDSDIVHVRRADGVSVDCLLHVNPRLPERGLAMLFNPSDKEQAYDLTVPLYYTGLTEAVTVREKDGRPKTMRLDRGYGLRLKGRIPAHGMTWLTFES
jgi:hypothetical protein